MRSRRISNPPNKKGPTMNLKELLAAMGKCNEELKALHAKCEAAEKGGDAKIIEGAKSEFDAKKKEFDGLKAKAEAAKDEAARAKSMREIEELSRIDPPGVLPDTEPAQAKDHEKDEDELCKEFGGFIRSGGKVISDRARDALRPQSKSWNKANEGGVRMPTRLARAAFPSAFHGLTSPEEIDGAKALPMKSVTATGQDAVNREYRDLLRYPGEAAHIFPRTRRVPTMAGKTVWPRVNQAGAGGTQYGGVVVTWTGEGADKTDTEALIDQVSIDAFELSAYTELSRTLLNRSAFPLDALVRELFSAAILDGVDTALLSGDGSSKPLGILHATSDVGTAARAVVGEVNYDDLIDLETAVLPQLRTNAVWLIADGALQALKKQKDDMGRPLFMPNPGSGRYDTLIGYPVIPTQRQTLGAAGDVVLADLSQMVCPVEQEVVLASSEHFKFKSGVVAMVVFMLVGGKVVSKKAFSKLLA